MTSFADKAEADELRIHLAPVPAHAIFQDPDFYIWCGSPVRDDDGRCWLFYSRWPRAAGHEAWVTHSEISVAVAEEPGGIFRHQAVVLPPRGAVYWDGLCTHNPTVHRFPGHRGCYFLYYMGNTGDGIATTGLNWEHRNRQRVGVAWADHPLGPWHRSAEPLIAPTPDSPDALCCTNPTVTQRPNGSFLMIYKGVGRERRLPFGGPVVHLAAEAADPLGPFVKQPGTCFILDGVDFPAEDPFLFFYRGRYWSIVKDMGGHFTGAGKSLALFVSDEGLVWNKARRSLVSRTELLLEGGRILPLHSLERPQLLFNADGEPEYLFCAADSDAERRHSFNVAIPLVAGPTSHLHPG